MPEYISPDEEERQEVSEAQPSALAILNQSEHSAMVVTANLPSNRRKLAEFDSKLMAYANHSQPVALSMFYSLPRAGKQIIGPSVRYAEIVAPCWKNNAVASRVIGDGSNTVTAQGIFLDYEANIRNSIEVPRRITDKNGNRFSDDMIITTSNAAMSVARRNAVLKGGVPQALWTPPYEAAQLTAVGKAASHAQRVADAMEFLHKMGLTEWQILNAVGVPSVRELETEHLVTLRVLCQEIKRGDKTIEMVFGSEHDKEIDALFAQLKMNQAQQTMLRNSYLGRAQLLVTYLRERLGSASPQGAGDQGAGTRATKDQGTKEPGKQSVEDWIKQKSTPAYAAKQPAAPGLSGEPMSQEPFNPNKQGESREEFERDRMGQTGEDNSRAIREAREQKQAAAGLVPPLGTVKDGKTVTGADGELVQQWSPMERAREAAEEVEKRVTVSTPDGGSSTASTVSGGTGEQAARRGRGRPSAAEMARRRAAEQSAAEPQPEMSEREAREQVENMVEQVDQFAF